MPQSPATRSKIAETQGPEQQPVSGLGHRVHDLQPLCRHVIADVSPDKIANRSIVSARTDCSTVTLSPRRLIDCSL